MVYLDRPTPAGYFIFPDLSVRHEGKYRLSFNLYEELKDGKDDDQADDASTTTQGAGEAHVTHRLEVKSQPFTVYSAKKFPGLATSTNLSRTVAEQGCRVRIRRDVRMRRREKTDKGDWDGYEEETAYDRARHASTPDMYGPSGSLDRQRSSSIASHVSLAPHTSRRPSGQEIAHYQQPAYPAQSSAPPTPQTSYPSQSAYRPSPTQSYSAQFPLPQSSMPPPPTQLPAFGYSQAPGLASQHAYYGHAQPSVPQPITQQHYDAQQQARNQGIDQIGAMSQDSRRSSAMSQAPAYAYPAQSHSIMAHPNHYAPSAPTYNSSLATAQPQQAPPTAIAASGTSMPTMAPQILLPPLPSLRTTYPRDSVFESLSPTSAHQFDNSKGMPTPVSAQSQFPPMPPVFVPPPFPSNVPVSVKRSYGDVFDDRHINGPLRQGARPNPAYTEGEEIGEDEVVDPAVFVTYHRADGRRIVRPIFQST